MSWQRRHGQPIRVSQSKANIDRRGNEVIRPVDNLVELKYYDLKAAITPGRGSRAEVPGQQEINIYKVTVDPDLKGVDLWSQVEWNGQRWDIVAPPVLHPGTRRTRHWSFDIRLRPSGHEDDLIAPTP